MGDLWACREQLSELWLLMTRTAIEMNPQAVRDMLLDLLAESIGEVVADLKNDLVKREAIRDRRQ